MKLRHCIAGCASAVAIAAVSAAPDQALAADITVPAPVATCERPIELTVSGQVNRAVLYADNGDENDVFFVDNDNSSTRVRWRATGDIDCVNTVGALIETQFESNSTAAISFEQPNAAGPNNFTERHMTVWWENDNLGRLWLGQGDMASNGISEIDLSGTTVIAYSGVADLAGGLAFAAPAGSETIGGTFSNFDGLSRQDRIRYDTPTFAGFRLSGSIEDDESWDVALRYAGEFGFGEIAAGIAYYETQATTGGLARDRDGVSGSGSILFNPGLSLTVAAGIVDPENSGGDPYFVYGKIGYETQLNSLGTTAFSIDGYYGEDISNVGDANTANGIGDESMSFGAAIVQNIDIVRTEVYLAGRYYELEDANSNNDGDIYAIISGARVRF